MSLSEIFHSVQSLLSNIMVHGFVDFLVISQKVSEDFPASVISFLSGISGMQSIEFQGYRLRVAKIKMSI